MPATGTLSLDISGTSLIALNQTISNRPLTQDIYYIPQTNFTGTASFTYTITDSSGIVSNTATRSIRVNTPSTASHVVASGNEDTVITLNLYIYSSDNKYDCDLNTLRKKNLRKKTYKTKWVKIVLYFIFVKFNECDQSTNSKESTNGDIR